MTRPTIKIVLYSDVYKNQLQDILYKVSSDVFKSNTVDLESFISNHWCIYLATIEGKVVGLTSYVYNTYYGLRPATLGLDYLYVLPEFRKTRVTYRLIQQTGLLSIDNQLPLEHYYASEEAKRIGSKLKGTKLYDTYVYEVSEVERVYSKLISKIPLKEQE